MRKGEEMKCERMKKGEGMRKGEGMKKTIKVKE